MSDGSPFEAQNRFARDIIGRVALSDKVDLPDAEVYVFGYDILGSTVGRSRVRKGYNWYRGIRHGYNRRKQGRKMWEICFFVNACCKCDMFNPVHEIRAALW